MKIKFIYPKFEKFLETYPDLAEFPEIAATWAYTMPPAMGIPILAGLTPKDIEWHVQDQNIESINFDDNSDLIAISYFTPQSGYAYELGDEFMKRGKTVVMGGMHPSMIPEDAKKHCHAVCIGEGDTIWNSILDDYKKGKLKEYYKSECYPEGDDIASPLLGIFDVEDKYDWHASLLSVTRGCPFSCPWCNIHTYQGNKTRFRPMEKVVADMKRLSGKEFYVTDDMIMLKRKEIKDYMMELCDKVKDFNLNMFLSC
ncbi:MAG TPA: radical SAM protein, partial [Spirochaetota bacterium]|nr:radical SAM protein [Spirochaetota bacterium]